MAFVAVNDWWEHTPWSPEEMVVDLTLDQSLQRMVLGPPHASLSAVGSCLQLA